MDPRLAAIQNSFVPNYGSGATKFMAMYQLMYQMMGREAFIKQLSKQQGTATPFHSTNSPFKYKVQSPESQTINDEKQATPFAHPKRESRCKESRSRSPEIMEPTRICSKPEDGALDLTITKRCQSQSPDKEKERCSPNSHKEMLEIPRQSLSSHHSKISEKFYKFQNGDGSKPFISTSENFPKELESKV